MQLEYKLYKTLDSTVNSCNICESGNPAWNSTMVRQVSDIDQPSWFDQESPDLMCCVPLSWFLSDSPDLS